MPACLGDSHPTLRHSHAFVRFVGRQAAELPAVEIWAAMTSIDATRRQNCCRGKHRRGNTHGKTQEAGPRHCSSVARFLFCSAECSAGSGVQWVPASHRDLTEARATRRYQTLATLLTSGTCAVARRARPTDPDDYPSYLITQVWPAQRTTRQRQADRSMYYRSSAKQERLEAR